MLPNMIYRVLFVSPANPASTSRPMIDSAFITPPRLVGGHRNRSRSICIARVVSNPQFFGECRIITGLPTVTRMGREPVLRRARSRWLFYRAIGRDPGRRPAEAPIPPSGRSTYRDRPRSRLRPRASPIVMVRSCTPISISLPRIFDSSGRYGTSVNASRPLITARRCSGRSMVLTCLPVKRRPSAGATCGKSSCSDRLAAASVTAM
jgi:hypothetical protein